MTLDHTDNAGERVLYNGIGHTSVICVYTCLLFWFATSPWCKLKSVAIKTLIADFAMIIQVPSQNLQQWPLTENAVYGPYDRCATIQIMIRGKSVVYIINVSSVEDGYMQKRNSCDISCATGHPTIFLSDTHTLTHSELDTCKISAALPTHYSPTKPCPL